MGRRGRWAAANASAMSARPAASVDGAWTATPHRFTTSTKVAASPRRRAMAFASSARARRRSSALP